MATHGTCKFWHISCLSNNFSDKILLILVAKTLAKFAKKREKRFRQAQPTALSLKH